MAPSWAIWLMPLINCFLFMVSIWRTLAKCSGAKVGIPSNWNFPPGAHKVSPMEKIPGSNTPMMSPAYASSMIFLLSAISCWGWVRRIFFPPWTWFTSIPASNFPEQIRMNAILSLWALFMLAWILNTKAENFSSNGSTWPSRVFLGSGEEVIFKKCSRKVSTPKLVRAEPKNTGESSPRFTNSWSNSSLAPSKSSISSLSWAW